LLIGSAGEKSAAHVAIELLRLRHGLPIEPIAYNGGNAALQAVATKQVSTALVPLPAVLSYLGAGRIKALAIAEPRRHPGIPTVQTTAEGGVRDFEATGWFGFLRRPRRRDQ
jgi:tripartite-type tricarboxylate transporter receptor subunit TctC